MKKNLAIIIFLLLCSLNILQAKIVQIDENTKYINILSQSEIYIDKTRKLDIENIQDKKFQTNTKNVLGFGYNPNLDVWLRFTIKNNSNETIEKILEYDNPLTTNIEFFYKESDKYKVLKDGVFYLKEDRSTKNPIFFIKLKPNETKTYYVKTTSHITTLIVKLKLWDNNEFFNKEIKNQFVLALFFGAMFILGCYNLFIYFITKDISYMYYVVYIFSMTIHHLLYVGIGNIYLFDRDFAVFTINIAALFITIPILALALFTRSFLNTKQYKLWNKTLNLFIYIVPVYIAIVITTGFLDKYRTLVILILFTYLVMITIYATIKRNKQAYYILFGWSIILISATFMFLSSTGVFDFYQYMPYIVEVSIILEALIFSIALAAKIKTLQEETEEVNEKLFIQQKNEQVLLREQVAEKTKELQKLNKDLERRVKEEVSRTKRIERKFMETEKMAAMGEMMGNIAHQWRQPLSVISTESSGLIVRKDFGRLDDESFHKSLNRVIDMTKHLSQTIDDFRDYIKGENKKIEFTIDDCIHKAMSITHPSLKSNYVQEVIELDHSIKLNTYENILIQSLVNIINNAKDALKDVDSASDRYIFVKAYKKDKKVCVSVTDTAGGVQKSIIDKIFDAYFTTKGEKEGTGLGLHMTMNMVTSSLEGTVDVRNVEFEHNSKQYVGAEFVITL